MSIISFSSIFDIYIIRSTITKLQTKGKCLKVVIRNRSHFQILKLDLQEIPVHVLLVELQFTTSDKIQSYREKNNLITEYLP